MNYNDDYAIIDIIRLEDVFRSSPCYISVQDPDLKIIEVNDNIIKVFGNVKGRYCYKVYKGRDDRCDNCPVEQTFLDGHSHRNEQIVMLPGSGEVPVIAYTSPVFGSKGNIIAVVEVAADIAQIKNLEEKLRESREQFRLLFEEAPCYISVQDRDLRIVQANRLFRRDFGEWKGTHCYNTYKHREDECLRCPVSETFGDGKGHTSEEVVTSLTGRRIDTFVSTAPIVDQNGEIDRVIEMSINITPLRELQGQLTNLGLMIGSMSHGLKGLLTGLDGGAYLLNTGLEKNRPDRIEKGWGMIQRNIAHIRSVVMDLLYLAGEEQPTFESVHIGELTASITKQFEKRAADLQLNYEVELSDEVGACDVDANSLKESIRNILDYTFEACRLDNKKQNHFVTVKLYSDGDNAVFDIEDNGIGMDRESREKMFSPFFSSKETASTGLGLFTANKVIEKHRGVIEVKSEIGKGTAFNIRIPKVRSS